MLISVQGTGKNYLQPGRESMGDAPVLSPVSWSIVVKEKPTVGSPISGASPSDRIPKATKDVNVYFFINSSNYRKLY